MVFVTSEVCEEGCMAHYWCCSHSWAYRGYASLEYIQCTHSPSSKCLALHAIRSCSWSTWTCLLFNRIDIQARYNAFMSCSSKRGLSLSVLRQTCSLTLTDESEFELRQVLIAPSKLHGHSVAYALSYSPFYNTFSRVFQAIWPYLEFLSSEL